MARNYDIAGFGTADGITPQAAEKLNSNFRRVLSLVSDETPRGSEMASIINEVVVDSGTAGVTGVKGEMQSEFETGRVSIALEETGEKIDGEGVGQMWMSIVEGIST